MSERLMRDVFPAELALPDGSVVLEARVFVTSLRVIAYVAESGQIRRAVCMDLTVPGAVEASRSSLQGSGRLECPVAGGTVWVNRGRGCGCHSPLKALALPVQW